MSTTDTATFVATERSYPRMPVEHPYNLRRALERFERDYLHNILVLADWDKAKAAKMLGIRLKTLETKLKKYDDWGNGTE